MNLKMYIDGKWQDTDAHREIINPATGETIATAAEGSRDDAQKAIQAAKVAFDKGKWANLPANERAAYLFQIADKIDEKAEAFTRLETMDNGKTRREAGFDVVGAADCFRYYAGLTGKPTGQTYEVADPVQPMVVHEPIGVCGLIVPWNYPLLMSVWKLAPALAAGNTVILKPSEITPVTAIRLFEIFDEVGLPKGVVNLVLGAGVEVGDEIACNDQVDKISFTGGTVTGRHIMRAATGNLKKVSLELGGKSPNIVFADADFDMAVDYALFGIYSGSGQVCSAGSRILLEEGIHDRFVERFAEGAQKIKVGPGDDPASEMGPLVSAEHLDKVMSYISLAHEEGARLLCGGHRITENGLDRGFFVEPTAFTNTTEDMRIVQEEIFGPVAVFQTFKDEEEAIRLANGTKYGLAGSVFTQDGAKALRVIKRIRAGITWINMYHSTYNEAPWGGYKQSGIGRGLGTYGLEEFLEVKQINVNLAVEQNGWFSG